MNLAPKRSDSDELNLNKAVFNLPVISTRDIELRMFGLCNTCGIDLKKVQAGKLNLLFQRLFGQAKVTNQFLKLNIARRLS